jgi:hypothetical protein
MQGAPLEKANVTRDSRDALCPNDFNGRALGPDGSRFFSSLMRERLARLARDYPYGVASIIGRALGLLKHAGQRVA